VSYAGGEPLAEASDRLGTTEAISRRPSGMRERRSNHDPGHVVRDLAVMLADGGGMPFGPARGARPRAAVRGRRLSTAFRIIDRIAGDPELLAALRAGRARARENRWRADAAPDRIVIDIDATLIWAHSEKDGAAGTFKGGLWVSSAARAPRRDPESRCQPPVLGPGRWRLPRRRREMSWKRLGRPPTGPSVPALTRPATPASLAQRTRSSRTRPVGLISAIGRKQGRNVGTGCGADGDRAGTPRPTGCVDRVGTRRPGARRHRQNRL